MPTLPELPHVEVDVTSVTTLDPPGFLTLKRYSLAKVAGQEPVKKRSRPFPYDIVDRRAMDAAIMVAHCLGEGGKVEIYLRSSIRPPVALRGGGSASPVMWELPAGLIEPGEEPAAAAARELDEELGFAVTAQDMQPLGPWAYPAPAMIGEKHFYFHVRVDPAARKEPSLDGSPLEEDGVVARMPLDEALADCERGFFRDAKTELALRRLRDVLR